MSKGGYAQISLSLFLPEGTKVADGHVKLRMHSPQALCVWDRVAPGWPSGNHFKLGFHWSQTACTLRNLLEKFEDSLTE